MSLRPLRGRWPGVLLGLVLAFAAVADGSGFRVVDVQTRVVDGIVEMDARLDYGFSPRALEALANGVPLTIDVHVQVRAADAWIWDDSLVDRKLRYQLRYRPLAEAYLVTRLPGQEGRSYVTREAALEALGDLRDVQLLGADRLDPAKAYEVHLRASLDIEELPLPLRPTAYLSGDWKHVSEWTRWPLQR